MDYINKIKFTDDEIEALVNASSLLGQVECAGIDCKDCPFFYENIERCGLVFIQCQIAKIREDN